MTEATAEIRSLAREFAAAELRPHTEHWDADRSLGDDIIAKVAELGFFGMLIPEDAGGMGMDLSTYTAALEELGWGEPAVAVLVAQSAVAAMLLHRYGGPEHAETLSALAAGTALGCIAFAEQDSHDSLAALDATAAPAQGGLALSGTKRWVTGIDRADVAIVAVQDAGTADGDGGAALLVVPRNAGGRISERADTLGLRALTIADLVLDGITVDDSARLDVAAAAPGGGRDALSDPHTLMDPVGALSIAAIAVGIAQAALEHAVAYADEREQFGRKLRMFEGIRNKLAEMAVRTAGARALLASSAADPTPAAVAMAKLAAGTAAMFVTTEAVQVFGGYGYMRDYPVEKLMRDAKAMEIMHGANEVQRTRIALSLYSE